MTCWTFYPSFRSLLALNQYKLTKLPSPLALNSENAALKMSRVRRQEHKNIDRSFLWQHSSSSRGKGGAFYPATQHLTSKTKVLQLPAAGVWHGSVKTAKF